MTFDKAVFGRAVASRRKAMGYPQTNVPGGPSSSYLSDIERGKMDPITVDTIEKLAIGLQWDSRLLHAVLGGDEPVGVLPTGPANNDEPLPETEADRILREATDAQARFDKAVDDLLTAEAALDRANQSAFRLLLIGEQIADGVEPRVADRSVSATDIAKAVADYGTSDAHEWTRYEIALIERFDPEYTRHSDDLATFSRFMDMTPARKRASRIPLADDELAKRRAELSEPDESMKPAADDVHTGADEEPGGSEPNE